MNLVADTNIIVASILKNSVTQDIIFSKDMRIFVPEYVIEEIEKHKEEFKEKMCADEGAFTLVSSIVFSRVTIVPQEDYLHHKEKAIKISPDERDWPFLALAMHLRIPLWSNDARLKDQNFVEVFDTREIIAMLGCGK